MVPDASSRRPKDFEIGLRAAYVATLAPTSDFWSSVVTSKRVPAGDQPAEFHVVGAESISVADIVRGAFEIRDALRGEHDAIKDSCRCDKPGKTLSVDDRDDALGMVAADRPEGTQKRPG